MAINNVRPLAFSDPFIDATLVENARDFTVESGVTINLDDAPMQIGGIVPSVIPPWKSTTLRNARIKAAKRVAVIRVLNETNLWYCIRQMGLVRQSVRQVPADDAFVHLCVRRNW